MTATDAEAKLLIPPLDGPARRRGPVGDPRFELRELRYVLTECRERAYSIDSDDCST